MSSRHASLAIIAIALAATAGTAAAAPGTTSFTARITNPAGTPIDGPVGVRFRLYDAPTAGNMVWQETQDAVVADKGLIFVRLGAITPLDDTTFPGGARYLEITVDDDVLSPRLSIDSVPYAIASATADRALTSETLGDLTEAEVQQRVGNQCPAGSSIRAIAVDGTVTCEADDAGAGTITGVTAGSGLSGGGATGAVSLSVNTATIQSRVGSSCAAGSSIRAIAADGTVTCEADDAGAGTITGVTAGTGLSGGGASGAVSLSVNTNLIQSRVGGACAAGQSIRAIAADGTVTCELDDDTNSGGTITGVTAGSGLSGGGTSANVSLSVNTALIQARVGNACAAGQSIRAIAADGTVTCEVDDDTNSGGTITGVTASTGLSGGGTSGGVSLSVNTAVIQARVGNACAAGQSIRAIAADGTVTCEVDDDTNSGGTITGVTAGTGLSGGGASGGVSLAVNTGVIQARVATACTAGSSIRAIAADGSVTCEADDDTNSGGTITSVTAGTGLSGGGTSPGVSLSVNTAVIQARVATACTAGSSIRAIAADGSVTCETDDAGGVGTITGVTAGSGLTGGGASGGVTVGIAPGGVTMAHTSAPIGSGQVSSITGVPPSGANYYPAVATSSFTADSNGSCLVISRVLTGTTNQSLGFLKLLSSVKENGADITLPGALNNTDPIYSISTLSILAQTTGTSTLITTYGHQATNERVIPVTAGRTYQFGCLLGWQSQDQIFANSSFTCHVSYVCQ